MRNRIQAGTALLLISLSGCIGVSLSIGGSGRHRAKARPPEVVIVSEHPAAGPERAEIDAAARLAMDSSRVEALRRIAARPQLSPGAQVHLAVAVFDHVTFESGKVSTLQTLIQNPSFSEAARQTVLVRLHELSFEAHKTSILQLLDKKAGVTPP